MLKGTAVLLAMTVAGTLAACQPGQEGGGGGGASGTQTRSMGAEAPGDHFEEAYTHLAEVHVSLVQGDWNEAADAMKDVRENLDGMKQGGNAPLPAVVTSRINALQRSALELDQMIANRNPQAVEASRTLMNTFTRESTLAQVGREGGGAGATPQPQR